MLTLGRYAHLTAGDRTKALDALPTIDFGPETEQQAARATGTYDVTAADAQDVLARRRARSDPNRPSLAMTRHDPGIDDPAGHGVGCGVSDKTCYHPATSAVRKAPVAQWIEQRSSKP